MGLLGLERGLRFFDEALEHGRFRRRQLRKLLAIETDTGALQAIDEAGIGQTMLADTGVDALDPERAEFTLARLTVTVGIAQRLLDLFNRDTVIGRIAANI